MSPVQPLAAIGEPGALLLADLDVALVLVELALVDHRADLRPVFQGVVDDQTLHAFRQCLDESVVDAAVTTTREEAVQRWPVWK